MSHIALRVILTACLCWSVCLSENPEQNLIASLREAVGEIKSLSRRLTEIDNKFTTKFGELQGGLELLQGQLVEMQESSKLEFQHVEKTIQGCSSEEQLSNLTVLLAKDECADGSHGCSPLAVCEDVIVSYRCNCLPGYFGDGFTCEDFDECLTGENRCHDNAQCNNIMGNYTCACNPGFSGDGFSCEDVDECSKENRCHDNGLCNNIMGNYTCACLIGYSGDGINCEAIVCDPPSHFFPTLGCITPVTKEMKWEEARQNCLNQEGRLLQGITTTAELQQLDGQFQDVFSYGTYRLHVWLGLKGGIWIESGEPINDPPTWTSSSLWQSGQPNRGENGCGYVLLDSTPSLWDTGCRNSLYSLCQKI